MGVKNRILVICNQSLSESDTVSAVRPYNMYKSLEKRGCHVIYLDAWTPSFSFSLKNISNWFKIFLFRRDNNNSKIFIENTPSFFVLKLIRGLTNVPIIIDVRDDYNLHADSMAIETTEEVKIQRELSKVVGFEIAEKVLVSSPSITDYYIEKHSANKDKFVNIENATDLSRFKAEPFPTGNTIGFLGGFQPGEGIERLLDASLIVKERFPDLILKIGYKYLPQSKQYVRDVISKYKKDWVEFYENIDYNNNASDFFSSLNVFVIPRNKTKMNDIAVPSKIFDAMASGRPQVVTDLEQLSAITKKENSGLVCDLDYKDMASKIIKLLSDRNLAEELGKNGRKAAEEKHNWEIRSQKILDKVFN